MLSDIHFSSYLLMNLGDKLIRDTFIWETTAEQGSGYWGVIHKKIGNVAYSFSVAMRSLK